MAPTLLLCILLQASIWTVCAIWEGPEFSAVVSSTKTEPAVVNIDSSTGKLKCNISLDGIEIATQLYIMVNLQTVCWSKVLPTPLDLETSTVSYAVILHDVYVKYYLEVFCWRLEIKLYIKEDKLMFVIDKTILPEELGLETLLTELQQRSLSSLVVEQRNALGESRWFLIANHDFNSVLERLESGFTTTVSLMPKDSWKAQDSPQLDGRIDSLLTIRVISLSNAVPKLCHLAEYMLITGVMLESEQAIYIEKSDSDPRSFDALLSFCKDLLHSVESSKSTSNNITKGATAEIEFQPRAGSSATPSSWTRLLGVSGFKPVNLPQSRGNAVNIRALKIYFTCLDMPIISQTIEENLNFLANKSEKKFIVIFELEAHNAWKRNPIIVKATVDWVTGVMSVKRIPNEHMSQTIKQTVNAYYWWLEEEKKKVEAKLELETQQSTVDFKDFEDQGELGKGLTAVVTLVKYDGAYYAMKSVDLRVETLNIECLHNEKKILQATHFKFLVSLEFYFEEANRMHFVMDFVRGGELFYLFRGAGCFSEDASRFYAAQLVLVLEYLHRNDIIYRDLKPENILVGVNGYLKLADLGFAEKLETNGRTTVRSGTPGYMAPEAIRRGDTGCGKGIDSWSLGIVLYEMLTGDIPFGWDKDKGWDEHDRKVLDPAVKVEYPERISPEAKFLLERLLERNVLERLTIEEAKADRFFSVVDFDAISNMKVQAPYTPIIDSNNLRKHFTQKVETEADPQEVVKNFPLFWNMGPKDIIWRCEDDTSKCNSCFV